MNLLCIDTSGPVCGTAVIRDGVVAYEASAVNKLTHSVNLMPMVQEALLRSGLTVPDVDVYAAVTGPGSFTGVRIGVSTVKGLAHGAGKPCVGVDALEALAASICAADGLICPLQDARAGQVYAAAFRPGLPPVRVLPDMAEKLDVFLDMALEMAGDRPLLFTGDGVKPNRAAIEARLGDRAVFPPAQHSFLRPAAAAMLAWEKREQAVDYLTLMPLYLRAPQAERERARKLGGKA